MVSLRPLGSKTSLTDEPDTPPRDNKTIFSVVFRLTICSKLSASDGNVEFSAIAERTTRVLTNERFASSEGPLSSSQYATTFGHGAHS